MNTLNGQIVYYIFFKTNSMNVKKNRIKKDLKSGRI